jgi:hypothetical protein
MTHIELLNIICKNKDKIDKAYIDGEVHDIPLDLIRSGIFRKIGRVYKLAETYNEFANIMLKKADIDIVFGNYIEEQKKLMKLKEEYLKSGELQYLNRIKVLVGKLYERLYDRDIGINAKVNDIISDNKLSIELIIKEAEDVDKRIAELIDENINIRILFNKEIMSIDNQELKELLVDIGIEMEILNNNIHAYMQRLSDFILRTKKRKEQNNKLASIANKIMNQKDEDLTYLLISNAQHYHHTIQYGKKNIKFLPKESHINKDNFIDALNNVFTVEKTSRKAPKKNNYKIDEPIEQKAINIEKLLEDIIKAKPDDIYKFISKHSELTQFNIDKDIQMFSFQAYLTIVLENYNNVDLTELFNENNIRIAKWI